MVSELKLSTLNNVQFYMSTKENVKPVSEIFE